MKTTIAIAMALLLALPPTSAQAQAPEVTLPPDAAAEHARAMAAYSAGNYAEALAGFRRAYAALPDPVGHREGRDVVLGSLRSTWGRLYETTRAREHLCAWRATLVDHTEALRAALGETAETERLADLTRRVDEDVARDFPAEPRCVTDEPAAPEAAAPAAVEPAPLPVAAAPVDRPVVKDRTRRTGGALLGVGVASLLGMTAALIVAGDRRRAIAGLDEELTSSGRPASADDFNQVDRLRRQGLAANGAAIAAGIVGGALVVTGAALMLRGRKHRTRASVGPQLGVWGIAVRGEF